MFNMLPNEFLNLDIYERSFVIATMQLKAKRKRKEEEEINQKIKK